MTVKRRCCWPLCGEYVRPRSQLCETHAVKTYWLMQSEHPDTVPTVKQVKAAAVSSVGTIYYLRVGDRIKIGWTSNLEQRLRSYPPGHTLLAQEFGTRQDEQAVHQRCTPWRCDGREWYSPEPGLLRVISTVKHHHEVSERLENLRSLESLMGPERPWLQERERSIVPFSDTA